jgi:putative holliday junction resolvase
VRPHERRYGRGEQTSDRREQTSDRREQTSDRREQTSDERGAMTAVRRGVRLAIDVGSVRVGVARSDPDALLATPVATLPRGGSDLDDICGLVADLDVVEVVVGLPRSLSGRESHAAAAAREYARALVTRLRDRRQATDVRLVDERLSTVAAERAMRAAGRNGRQQRAVVDQAAAVVILQHAIDAERVSGSPAGEAVRPG